MQGMRRRAQQAGDDTQTALQRASAHTTSRDARPWDELGRDNAQRIAGVFMPHDRIFGPTYGLDHRLFDEHEHLRPGVRSALLERLGPVISRILGAGWEDVASVSLAGSEASKWTGPALEGNNDLDVLVGVAHSYARDRNPGLAHQSDAGIAETLNQEFRAGFNDEDWAGLPGGPWHLTAYCNDRALDIRQIKPYAAYDLLGDRWVVKPPDLPHWSAASFEQGPAMFAEARAVAQQIRAVLRLPEPYRAEEARALWDHLHERRSAAFSGTGRGWADTWNVIEKYLDQTRDRLIEKLRAAVFGRTAAAGAGPVTIPYAHNRNRAPYMGETYGQHLEPHGRYLVARGGKDRYPESDWETGEITFRNPLHIPFGGNYSEPDNWKHRLSEMHGGKTGRALSRALVAAGHDAVITHDDHGMSEIVDLTGLRRQGAARERYAECDQGHEHWGAHGAAFLLMRHTDPADGKIRYLFQKRAPLDVDYPNSWGLPGGALHEGEDSYAGARREAREEMGMLPRMRRHHTVTDDHGGWKADTHVADVHDRFQPHASAEASGYRWVTKAEADGLDMHPGVAKTWDTVRRSQVSKEAVWDSSGSDKTGVYLRFGKWPENGRSFSPAGGYHEDGVSVYDLDKHGNPAIDHGLDRGHQHDEHCGEYCDLADDDEYGNDPKEEMQGRVARAERNRYYGNDKPSETAHLVRGELTGAGFDGEPLLSKVRRVGDWIDHRHLFVPGAEPHRLARRPGDEGYRAPAVRPPRRREAAADGGKIDLYHRTTPENAQRILREKKMTSEEYGPDGRPAVFFSTHPGSGSHAAGYGSAVVHVRIPEHLAVLDDEFPSGEQHYQVPAHRLRPEHFVGDMQHEAAVRQVPSRDGPDGVSKSMMVAIVPPAPALDMLEAAMTPLTRHDAEPRSKMHITVLYLGEEDDHPAEHLSKLPDLIRQWSKTVEPFHGKLQGAGTFVADGKHVLHALADIPGGQRVRTSLEDFLHGHGIHFPRKYGFIPHVTLAYSGDHVRFLPKITPVEFPVTEVWFCRGGRWESMPLGRQARRRERLAARIPSYDEPHDAAGDGSGRTPAAEGRDPGGAAAGR